VLEQGPQDEGESVQAHEIHEQLPVTSEEAERRRLDVEAANEARFG